MGVDGSCSGSSIMVILNLGKEAWRNESRGDASIMDRGFSLSQGQWVLLTALPSLMQELYDILHDGSLQYLVRNQIDPPKHRPHLLRAQDTDLTHAVSKQPVMQLLLSWQADIFLNPSLRLVVPWKFHLPEKKKKNTTGYHLGMCTNRNISISRLSIFSQKEIVIAPPASHATGWKMTGRLRGWRRDQVSGLAPFSVSTISLWDDQREKWGGRLFSAYFLTTNPYWIPFLCYLYQVCQYTQRSTSGLSRLTTNPTQSALI